MFSGRRLRTGGAAFQNTRADAGLVENNKPPGSDKFHCAVHRAISVKT